MTDRERDAMLVEMHADIKLLMKSDKTYEKVLFGNGQPGICKRVDTMQERQDECRRQSGKALVKAAVWASIASPLMVLALQQLLERI